MKQSMHIITLRSYIVLAFSGMLMNAGCDTTSEDDVESTSLEIRFQDNTAASPQPSGGLRRTSPLAAGSTTHDTVARIRVEISFADSGQPLYTNFELTKLAPDVWRGNVPFLPRRERLRFAARALSSDREVAFTGETLATLTRDNQSLEIPLAAVPNHEPPPMLQLLRIAYPGQIQAGAEEQIAFTIEANAGASVAIKITPLGGPMTPSADFSPATETVTLTNTVTDFMAVYTAPDVTVDTGFDYQVTIRDARAQSAAAVTTSFTTHVIPRPPESPIVHNIRPGTLFNHVILGLTSNGSETPGTVKLVAAVSADSAPDKLAFQWSYTHNPGTPDGTFANGGQGNPGLFQGYTVAHEGTITLAVTDEHNGTTTLHYQLAPDQFADPIDHSVGP